MSVLILGSSVSALGSDAVLEGVDAIKAEPIVAAAFRAIESRREMNMQRLIALTEIPAPGFAESRRAQALSAHIRAAGLRDVSIDSVGNLIARRNGINSTRTVALVAHLDTVFPASLPIVARRVGDVIHAPGVGDNTRALIALLTLIEVLEELAIQTQHDLVFIGSVGEEGLGDLRGVRHLLGASGLRIDRFIAMDGGSLDRVVVDGVGSNRYRVEFSGPGGHSYGAFGRAHPHQALAEAIVRFTQKATPLTDRALSLGIPATFSVGRIGGGTSINSIPFEAWMEVDMRSTEAAQIAALDAALRAAVAEALDVENARRTEGDGLRVELVRVGARPAGRGKRDSSLVRNAVDALAVLGIEAQFAASSTDANIAIARGIPAITIARGGRSRNAHSPDESWENVDAHLAVQAALLILLAEAGLVQPR